MFTAGDKLDESTVYTWQKDGAALTVPAETSPETALTTTLGSGDACDDLLSGGRAG